MRILVIYCLGLVILSGCEDSKKQTKTEVSTPTETVSENPELKPKSEPAQDSGSQPSPYPKITKENVVEFLTQYGEENPETRVEFETTMGTIVIELFKDTPLHRANFIYLIKQGYFDDTFFHRAVPDFIIQAGNSDLESTQRKRDKLGPDYLLPAEIIPGRIHQPGTVSGAKQYRENPGHQTAPYEFFIFLGPLSSTGHLNGKYTVFGKVTQGMDVVKKISEEETDSGEWPLANIYIKARVLE